MGIVADFAGFVFGSAILNIISCSFLMLLAIEAGLIVGPEVSPCSSGGGLIVGAINPVIEYLVEWPHLSVTLHNRHPKAMV